MPSIESYKESTKGKAKHRANATPVKKAAPKKTAPKKSVHSARPKRRPALEGMGNVGENENLSVIDMEGKVADKMADDVKNESPKFQFAFPGSELLRARFPKSINLTEVVVDEWMKDGKFENLPIEHPVAELMAQKSLRRAKEVEQKIMASPVVEKVVVQAVTTGFKLQNAWMQARKKFQK